MSANDEHEAMAWSIHHAKAKLHALVESMSDKQAGMVNWYLVTEDPKTVNELVRLIRKLPADTIKAFSDAN